MSHRFRCIVLVIRLTASLTLIVVWIIPSPYQSIGRGLFLGPEIVNDFRHKCNTIHVNSEVTLKPFDQLSNSGFQAIGLGRI